MMLRLIVMMTLLMSLGMGPVYAVNPDEILEDPELEGRARDISANLRCLVCQNQSIDDSDAELARDLRVIVRERLVSGDSNSEVIDYVVDRYGEFVLLRPTLSGRNFLLWGTPVIVFLLGGLIAVTYHRKRGARANVASLSAEEEARLNKLLDDQQDN